MERHICQICGYAYDPAEGDAPKIAAGTAWNDVPEDWKCPVCGASKSEFNPE